MVDDVNFSVSNDLNSKYGIDILPGRKGSCPECGKKTFSIKMDNSIGKCFHPSCNKRIILDIASNGGYENISLVLERIYNDFHRNLLLMEDAKKPNTYNYLLKERLIHPQVITDSMLGAVPTNYDIRGKFEPIIKKAEGQVEMAMQSRKEKRGRPKKFIGPTPDEQLVWLREARNKLEKCVEGSHGWLCFFYTDNYHRIVAIRFRKPYTKQILYFKPFENVAGLFGLGLFTPDQTNNIKELKDILIVTEGEFNQLQLQSLSLRYGEAIGNKAGYLFACAAGGVNNADYEMIKKIGRSPIICYDHDDNDAGLVLVERALQTMSVNAFTTPQKDSDLDNYIRSFGENYIEAWEEISLLISQSKFYPRDYSGVAKEIFSLRQKQYPGGKLKAFEVNNVVANLIIEDFKERGSFYYNSSEAYFFVNDSKKLIRINGGEKDFNLLMDCYGLNSTEAIFKYLQNAIELEVFRNGTETEIYTLGHYNDETSTAYVFNQSDIVYRISAESIDKVDNGMLFISDPNSDPFELVEVDDSCSKFNDIIVSKINFSKEFLSPNESRLIFTLWSFSLFFGSIQPTRPILAMLGPKGSGKSMTLRMIGILLYGGKFNVTGLTRDIRDFDAMIIQKDFIVVDNAEDQPEWFNDRLAILATGGSLKKRQLFTNDRLLEKPIRAFVAVTSRKPNFTRDDVSDRLIILKVDRLKKFQAEDMLLKEVLINRNLIMSEIVQQLQEIVIALKKEKDNKEGHDFRIADFASFVLKIARGAGIEKAVKRILAKLMREQSVFTLESEPIFDLLWVWAIKNPDREVTAADLCKELSAMAAKLEVNFAYRGNTRGFAQKIGHMKSDLEEFFEISYRRAGGRKKYYRYKPKI